MSAYMIDDESYSIFLHILNDISGNPMIRQDFKGYPTYYKNPVDVVKAMVKLNADSVDYRYDGHGLEAAIETVTVNALLDKQDRKPGNCAFTTYAKLPEWYDLKGFCSNWAYQSCELTKMSMEQQSLYDWVVEFGRDALEYGLKKHLNRRASWGMGESTKALFSASEPKVISILDMAKKGRG